MTHRHILSWLALGVLAALTLGWALHRSHPLFPLEWTVSRGEAEVLALAALEDLGELPADPYIIVNPTQGDTRQLSLLEAVARGQSGEQIQATGAYEALVGWRVTLYSPDKQSQLWEYRAGISPTGRVTQLSRRYDEETTGAAIEVQRAMEIAHRFLERSGVEVDALGEPEMRTTELENRVDTVLRYVKPEPVLGDGVEYGVEVKFAGDQLAGFSSVVDHPEQDAIDARFQGRSLWDMVWIFAAIPLTFLVAIPFVRRYHAGEVGVQRGLQIGAVVLACGATVVGLALRGIAESWSIGVLTRPQVTAVVGLQMIVGYFIPIAAVTFLSWSVGESVCRERWGSKLAGLDALFRGRWRNATLARAFLHGTIAGLALAAMIHLAVVALENWGVYPNQLATGGPWSFSTSLFSVALVAMSTAYGLYVVLFCVLFLVPLLSLRLGRWVGPILAVALGALLFFPPIVTVPVWGSFVVAVLELAILVFVFLRWGVLEALFAKIVSSVLPAAWLVLTTEDANLQLQAAAAMGAIALPMLLSARFLQSRNEFVYRYDEVPPHVRRIAERERQKVELETARRIQSSILPELPPELNGLRIAHTYEPADEVGGDFYDVLALEDGRVALAVGDVAGHGVSSGLVMSMAKSALAVQTTFNPDVEAVFGTLNRMVFQSARKRLLTTLCYAIVDVERRELVYGSAGHLFPYRVERGGSVEALESVAYPLGVRDRIEIRARTRNLEEGDMLFLFSDGVVEACAPAGDEPFGFGRLEESLVRHAGGGAVGLRDGVLSDLRRYVGAGSIEDDLTILAVQLPH